ncbi:MAG: hypothetical protein GX491_00170 [Chloroflexi bacterium]|nr:hypothetical protein [Chloroflexota bacterium]
MRKWFMPLAAAAAAGILCIAGCTPAIPAAAVDSAAASAVPPVVDSAAAEAAGSPVTVTEYPLVEQSVDNPTHPGFQERARSAVAAQEAGLLLPGVESALQARNRELAPFGYQLAPNPRPPFSAYALSYNGRLVDVDIARFWPGPCSGPHPCLLEAERLDGERFTVTAQAGHETGRSRKEPAGQKALAYTGTGLPLLDPIPETGGADSLEINHQPVYFRDSGGQVVLNYAGNDLPNRYDRIAGAGSGDPALYHPGSRENIVWFYALRDGLWYYVEIANHNF